MVGTLDSQVIEKFKEFQEKTGKYLDLKIEEVEFEKVYLSDENFFEINPKKREIDISLKNSNIEISFVPLEKLDEVNGIIDSSEKRKILDVWKGYTYFKENDVIFTKVTPSMENGNFAIAKNLINGLGFGSSEYYVFRCKNVLPELLWLLFRTDFFRQRAKKTMRGAGGLKRVPLDFFDTQYITIPKKYKRYESIDIQKILVDFLVYWKINYTDLFRQTTIKQRPIIEKIKRALIPATLKYDKVIANSFDNFVQNKGIKLKLEDIKFNDQFIYKNEDESLIELLNSQRVPITKNKRVKGTYPYYGASGISDYINDYIFDDRLVLLGEDGAKWSANENSSFIAEGKFWVNNHVHIMKPIKDLLKDTYLVLILNMMNLDKYVNNSIPRKLSQTRLKEIEIKLPYNSNFESIELQEILIEFWEMILSNIDNQFNKFENIVRLTDKIDEAFLYRTFSKIEWRKK
jgi:hypothetical protein